MLKKSQLERILASKKDLSIMPYDPQKAAQTIAFFAMQEGNTINVLKVIKLVYLADRESLRRRGHPIQHEARVSMPHGPVNSTTLDYLNGAYRDDGGWSVYLSDRSEYRVGIANANLTVGDLDALSSSEIEILRDVWAEFGGMSGFDLADWTHNNIVEWQNPDGSSVPIPLDRMMTAVGLDRPIERANELLEIDNASRTLSSL